MDWAEVGLCVITFVFIVVAAVGLQIYDAECNGDLCAFCSYDFEGKPLEYCPDCGVKTPFYCDRCGNLIYRLKDSFLGHFEPCGDYCFGCGFQVSK